MFGFLKPGKKGDNPLNSLKNVTRWVENLPTGDIFTAQGEVVAKLVEFNQSSEDFGKARLAVLRGLDEQSREMQTSLCAQYLRNPRMSKMIETRLWTSIHALYFELARAYHAFLMHFVANPGGRKIQSQVPLITARALRALADILKWRYFHYERIDEKLWLRLHNLYRMAEFEGFAEHSLILYDGDSRRTSAREAYVRAAVLSLFGNGSLVPKQIEMIDTWLDNWSGPINCDSRFDVARHDFYLDTSAGHGLSRIRNPGENPAWRYLSSAPLRARIDEVRTFLRAGKTPATLGLGEDFRLPDGYALLDLVEAELSAPEARNRRKADRQPRQGRWEIVRDIPSIYIVLRTEQLPASGGVRTTLTPEEILDIKLYGFVTERTRASQHHMTAGSIPEDQRALWFEVDESEQGIGFAVTGAGINWAKAGRLLAMRRQGGDDPWRIGVVRRVVASDAGQRVVGIRLLAGELECVELDQEPLLSDPLLARDGYEVLDTTHGSGNLVHALRLTDANRHALLLESARYAHARQYLIRYANASTELVQLDAVEDKGEGWLRAAYNVLAAG